MMEAATYDGCLNSAKFSKSVQLILSLSTDENLTEWGSGFRVESSVGGGVGLLERAIFFSSGVKGGRSCVQSS